MAQFKTNKQPVFDSKSASGAIATFNTALAMPLVNGEFSIEAYQEGTGDPSPSNVRNIVPRREVNIYQRGVNLWDEEWETGVFNTTTGTNQATTANIRSKNYIAIKGNVNYRILINVLVMFFDKNKNVITTYNPSGVERYNNSYYYTRNIIMTTPPEAHYMRFYTLNVYGDTYKNDISINYPSTDTSYHAYDVNSNDKVVNLGEDVYGAVYNSVTGKKENNTTIKLYDGSENWQEATVSGKTVFQVACPSEIPASCQFISNYITRVSAIGNVDNVGYYGGSYFNVYCSTVADVNSWKTMLQSTPMQVVYELNTPTETQLTPTQINTIIGQNNTFCDTGDTSVSYKDLDIAKLGSFREVFKIPENTKKLYGFKIDYENKTIDYLEDAVGMTPAYMDFTNNKFEYGSWENAFFMPRPCMLKRDGTVDFYLDPNNYDYRADGVTPSHVGHLGNYEASSTSSKDYAVDDYIVYDSKLWQVTSAITTGDTLTEGTNISEVENAPDVEDNAMLEWGQGGQHIWYRQITNIDGTESVYISNYRVNDTFNAWSFYDAKGMLKDHFYTPIYQGSIVNSVLRSISGMDYTRYCKSKTGAQEITLAEANNVGTDKGWYTEVNCDWVLMFHLLTLMSKSLNAQSKFGNGRCGQSSSETNMLTTGSMNDKGMFWGSNTNTYGVKVFGMENQWSNQWHRMAGLLLINNQWYYKLTRYTNDGSTATDYNGTGTGYLTQTGHTAPTANYVQEMYFTDDGAFYDKVTGSSTSTSVTMYQDYFYVNASGTRYALRGGNCSNSAVLCGACYVYVRNDFGNTHWSVGASVTYR